MTFIIICNCQGYPLLASVTRLKLCHPHHLVYYFMFIYVYARLMEESRHTDMPHTLCLMKQAAVFNNCMNQCEVFVNLLNTFLNC